MFVQFRIKYLLILVFVAVVTGIYFNRLNTEGTPFSAQHNNIGELDGEPITIDQGYGNDSHNEPPSGFEEHVDEAKTGLAKDGSEQGPIPKVPNETEDSKGAYSGELAVQDKGEQSLSDSSDIETGEYRDEALQPTDLTKDSDAFIPNFDGQSHRLDDLPALRKKLTSYYNSIGFFSERDRRSYAGFDDQLLFDLGKSGDLLALDVLLRRSLKNHRVNDASKLKAMSRVYGNAAASQLILSLDDSGLEVEHMLRARMGDYLGLFRIAASASYREAQRSAESTAYIERRSLEMLNEINKKRRSLGLQALPLKPDQEVVRYHEDIFAEYNLSEYLHKYLNFNAEPFE